MVKTVASRATVTQSQAFTRSSRHEVSSMFAASAEWVRDCRRLVELQARLPAILKGEATPTDADERLALADLCYKKGIHAAAARFFDEALAARPALADDPAKGHRYNAARVAALAGSGQGKDDPPPDQASRVRWREKALGWLRADLAAWGKLLATGPNQARPLIVRTLMHWNEDADLAGIRDGEALAKLPEAEKQAFRALWADVEALRSQAERSAGGGSR